MSAETKTTPWAVTPPVDGQNGTTHKIQLNILIAEDQPQNRKLLEKLLAKIKHEKVHYNYEYVENGQLAVEKFTAYKNNPQKSFDLILMDIQMPVKDGYAATTAIRALESEDPGVKTPIVALTADPRETAEPLAKTAGMDGFMSKPYKADELSKTLRDYAEQKLSQLAKDRSTAPTSAFSGTTASMLNLLGAIASKVAKELSSPTTPESIVASPLSYTTGPLPIPTQNFAPLHLSPLSTSPSQQSDDEFALSPNTQAAVLSGCSESNSGTTTSSVVPSF
jgi:CheY-like chemotaxis protein